jgi:hypothetical protein
VNPLDGYAGHFSLATAVEAHPAESPVQRLALNFSDQQQVLTDARVLLCAHIGALELVELGYPARSRCGPQLAAGARSKASRRADAARPTTELMRRT